jgi:CubicO group peptidase (beta-lactamase class C family)
MRFAALLVCMLATVCVVKTPAQAVETDQERVDRIFAAYDKPGSPGCALGVIRDGSFIYRKGYGRASLEFGVPLSSESIFYMGSVSKQFTAASVVLAAEKGFLSLDDNVREYIPELPEYAKAITLRQMLHHTSGLRDFLTLLPLSGRHDEDLHSKDELIALIARQKGLNNDPGAEFIYSNTNYFLLGEVVQRATRKPLAEFAAENIFKPLGMSHTRFYDDHTVVVPGRVSGYDPGTSEAFLVDWSTNYDAVGAGGLMSSVDDLLLWDRNFYENKLGKGTLLKELLTRGVLNDGKQIRYALGLEIGTYRGLPIVEHNGALFGYRTVILRFPEQRFTVLCLCNVSTASTSSASRKVADVYLEKNLRPEASAVSPPGNGSFPNPATFAGKYLDPRSHSIFSFTASADNLVAWGANLRRVAPNRFKDLGDGTITFSTEGANMRASLDVDGETVFAGSRIDQPHLSDADLAVFVGVYRSAELDATYSLSADKGSLVLRNSWNPPIRLNPVAQDEFEGGDLGTLVFRRASNHLVSGLSLFSGNARNVSFTKTD